MDDAPDQHRTWVGQVAVFLAAAVVVASLSVCSDRSPLGPSPGPGPTVPPTGPEGVGGADATVAVAGDIGFCGSAGPEATAAILDVLPGPIFTLGDHAYYSGTDREFRECFDPSWGRHRSRIRPVPGNHDYETPGAGPYFAYFGAAAGQPGLGYQAFRVGRWEIFALNSNIPINDGSVQLAWLQSELALRPSKCSLAYWHHPPVTEGPNGPNPHVRALWQTLVDNHVDVMLTGHDHQYQRFAPLDRDLRRAASGPRLFVVGTGGAMLYPFPAPPSLTEARSSSWGVLRLTLQDGAYEWEFMGAAGQPFRDAGRGVCE
jgi:hypothetical protein